MIRGGEAGWKICARGNLARECVWERGCTLGYFKGSKALLVQQWCSEKKKQITRNNWLRAIYKKPREMEKRCLARGVR